MNDRNEIPKIVKVARLLKQLKNNVDVAGDLETLLCNETGSGKLDFKYHKYAVSVATSICTKVDASMQAEAASRILRQEGKVILRSLQDECIDEIVQQIVEILELDKVLVAEAIKVSLSKS